MKAQIRRTQKGFTLIEALVALLVMSFGMLAVAGFQINLSLSSDVAKQRTEATRLAQEKMEELRTFDNLTSYASNMVSSTSGTEDTITSSTSNTSYLRRWAITTAATPDTGRSVFVTVAWTDRAGNPEQVQLFSHISATDLALNGSLFFPLPDGTILRRPKNRNIDIPIPAISIAGTGKSFIPWTGAETQTYLVFSDASGDIVQKCTDEPNADNLDTNVCTTFDGYLLSGYITGTESQVALVTKIVVPFGSQQYVNGTPECSVTAAINQTTNTAIAGTKSYVCLIQPTDHDSNANSARVWSGRVDLAGATKASLAGTYTCRFTTDENTTENDKHPAVYSLVDRSLDNQNFYISASNCASEDDFRVLHLTNTGQTYTVTYNANGGTGTVPIDVTEYAAGNLITVLASPTPTRETYTFLGWSLSSSGAVVKIFTMPTSNTTLYAQWTTSSTFQVTYNINGGTGSVPTDATSYLPGSTVTVLPSPTPTKASSTFGGWSLTMNGPAITSFTMLASNITLYAKWTEAYRVIYSANGGTSPVPEDAATYVSGSTVAVKGSPAPTRIGYNFAGWSLTAGGSEVTNFTMPANNTTLYARWNLIKWSTPTFATMPWSGSGDAKTLTWAAVTGANYKLYSCYADDAKTCFDFTLDPTSPIPATSVTTPTMDKKDVWCYKIVATGTPNSDSDASALKCVIRSASGSYSYL